MDADDIVGTLAGEYIDAKYVFHYLKAIDKSLADGCSHCSYRVNDVRIFALMTRLSSMRVRIKEWIINDFSDLEYVIAYVINN